MANSRTETRSYVIIGESTHAESRSELVQSIVQVPFRVTVAPPRSGPQIDWERLVPIKEYPRDVMGICDSKSASICDHGLRRRSLAELFSQRWPDGRPSSS
jgi:hypothetical protein